MKEILGSFIGGLKEWQTLVTGVFALIAAGIAWKQLNHQREESKQLQRRRARACKAILPVDLDSFIDYLHECYKITATIRRLRLGESTTVSPYAPETPLIPDQILPNMQALIEYLDEHNANILSEVMGVYQVQNARFRSELENLNERPPVAWPQFNRACKDLVFLYILIDDIFPFARGEEEKISLDFSEQKMENALNVLENELPSGLHIGLSYQDQVKQEVFARVVAAAQDHFGDYDIIT